MIGKEVRGEKSEKKEGKKGGREGDVISVPHLQFHQF